ncbi:MAG: ABC transporter permease [Chloroflexota bacterium]
MTSRFGLFDQIRRSFAIVRKDVLVYYSRGPVVLMGVLWPGFMFLSFAFGRQMPIGTLMPGLIAVSVFFTCSAIAPVAFPWETGQRTLERLISCPVAIWTILFGDMLASAMVGIIISIVPILIALAFGAAIVNPLALVAAILIGSFCFATMALLMSIPPVSSPQYTQMLSTMLKFPLMFISGVFVPLSKLPQAARVIALVSPLTYFTDIARFATGGENYFPVALDFLVLIIFTVIFWVIAVKAHNRTLPLRV